jgi:hypothetical protein
MPGQRYAVLIGNGLFSEDELYLRHLRCPANDVDGLKSLLSTEQYGSYVITTIIDGTHDVGRRAIYECLTKAKADDLVLIYYSGHGKLDEEGNLYLVSKDTVIDALPPTSIPIEDVKKYTRETRASAVVVILDCCFSGAVKKMFKGEVSDQASHAIRDLQGQGTFYLTASTDIQVAEEKEGDDYSLLTKYMIQGIREGTADSNDDGKISFQELCSFVQKSVAPEGKQRPKAWALDTAGEVIIAFTGKPASDMRRKAVTKKLYDLAAQDLLTDEIVGDLLAIINQPSPTRIAPGLGVKDLIDSLYHKIESTGEFVNEVFKWIHQLKHSPAAVEGFQLAGASTSNEVEMKKRRTRIRDFVASFLTTVRGTSVSLKIVFWIILGSVAGFSVFLSLQKTTGPRTSSPVENMIIRCDPACTTDTNFALSVSNTGPTNPSMQSPGVAMLGVLLPEPTSLRSWELTSDGNLPVYSGEGVPDYTSGDVFSLVRVEGNHPIDFNSFRRLSGDVGVKVTSYNVFAFGLGSFNSSGESIQPISFSRFSGAQGFPAGTIFFAFLVDDNGKGRIVNQTPLNRQVVVTPTH